MTSAVAASEVVAGAGPNAVLAQFSMDIPSQKERNLASGAEGGAGASSVISAAAPVVGALASGVAVGDSEGAVTPAAADAAGALKSALDSGLSDRDAVKQVSESLGLPRRRVYAEMLRLKQDERR